MSANTPKLMRELRAAGVNEVALWLKGDGTYVIASTVTPEIAATVAQVIAAAVTTALSRDLITFTPCWI